MRFSPVLPVFPHPALSGSAIRRLYFGCVLSLLLCLLPVAALGMVIQADTTWSGDVSLADDVLVPEGVTLTIAPGTTIRVVQAESTKTDPEFLSPQTEITVRGSLVANGSGKAHVTFRAVEGKNPLWAGIIIDGGSAVLRSTVIRDAETGVSAVRGSLLLHDSAVTQNRYGITVECADCVVRIEASQVSGNEYGVVLLNGAKIDGRDIVVQKNRKKDTFTASAKDYRQPVREYRAEKSDAGRVYGDEVILGTVVWQKRVVVQGIVRVPERSRLVILPGTIIEFRRKDTNGDGIGENGILAQGVIIAKGTKEQPIIFRSAEVKRRPGDWDAINIMNSDAAQNLLEYCQVEDAYRGLHFHFSNVAVTDSVIRNNYRGIQFQESVVTIRGTHIYGNKSGLQARDSEILFSNNVVSHNRTGMNVLRNSITVSGSMFLNNSLEGLRVREGLPVVEQNQFDGNRFGLMVSDAQYGTYTANRIAHNLESGLALRSTEGIEISGNAIQANGINGINVQDSSAVVKNNLISDNGERGIGIQSFHGIITANTIVRNKLYNLGIDGETDVSAPGNWWGGGDVRKTIFDKENDPSKGRATWLPMRERPEVFVWPIPTIATDTAWHGDVLVNGIVNVERGAILSLSPSTRALFAKDAGISVRGTIRALGEKNAPITFAGAEGGANVVWDEILIDKGTGSAFTYCSFANANWALHSHFTDLKVDSCTFQHNFGGLRFTSGPVEIKRSLFQTNEIGIRSFRGTALITENRITENRIGVFVREKGSGLAIRKNDLYGNSEYDIRLGDFNDEDVDARENWWGTGDPLATIFDGRSEPGIGMVLFEPVAKEPFVPASGKASRSAGEVGK